MTESAVAQEKAATGAGVETLRNYVGGRWVESRDRASFSTSTTRPAGEVIARTPLSTAEDVDAAVAAARKAFPAWRDTPPVRGRARSSSSRPCSRSTSKSSRAS